MAKHQNNYIRIRLSTDIKQQLKQYAAENGTTLSEVIRAQLEKLLN